MKRFLFAFPLFLILLSLPVYALEDNEYFSIDPETTYKCIYVNLPQDMGLTRITSPTTYIIETDKSESPWVDITYNSLTISPGTLNKNPICFSHMGKEGDYSFYRIRLYSPDLALSREVSGGFCVSEYKDTDAGIEAERTSNICELMSENADIFDLQFKHSETYVKPGETVIKTIYLTSYASLKIDLALITNLQTDFSSQRIETGPDHPITSKSFRIGAPKIEGNYSLIILGRVSGCGLPMCEREVESKIIVSENIQRSGFLASVIPKNINLKEARETQFRLIITNYDDKKEFNVVVSSSEGVEVDPKSITFEVGKGQEKTLTFKVTPLSNEITIYRIEFRIKTPDSERSLVAYLSVGELFSDAMRNYNLTSNNITDPDTLDFINRATINWMDTHNSSSYGTDLGNYTDFLKTLDDARKGVGNQTKPPPPPPLKKEEFDWFLVLIPIIIVVIILLFVAYKKSRVTEELEYPKLDRGF